MKSAALFVGILAIAVAARAHELRHVVGGEDAVVVEFSYGDGTPFADQNYRLYRPGETVPFQSGKTDLRGRIVFVPDREGSWRVQTFSEEGHGADITFELDELRIRNDRHDVPRVPWMEIVTGVGVIFGLFGIITLFLKRKSV